MTPKGVKSIPGYKGYYADRQGNIYSRLKSGPTTKLSNKYRKLSNHHCDGRYVVRVFSLNGKRKTASIHRIIAKIFIPNPNNYHCVLHKNNIKHDNRVCNLRWGTYSDNTMDSIKAGTHGRPQTNRH